MVSRIRLFSSPTWWRMWFPFLFLFVYCTPGLSADIVSHGIHMTMFLTDCPRAAHELSTDCPRAVQRCTVRGLSKGYPRAVRGHFFPWDAHDDSSYRLSMNCPRAVRGVEGSMEGSRYPDIEDGGCSHGESRLPSIEEGGSLHWSTWKLRWKIHSTVGMHLQNVLRLLTWWPAPSTVQNHTLLGETARDWSDKNRNA